ncbi:spermidine/putrescine transport system substrate-binding protein [Clostridium acetobutylicum]|uniref:Spermidine/putrescine-binding periplasmic protein n=1 Tax=Clostridium acetobutylicum (strain ATCC 824 / DSM 792 / JCM 1419 / IAM 19013 / LMG 5710 / NBRC 13948 / NRRL B-527 / VKM B-1787 / 2291 / W) TaxID=272562 RepID=Q97KS9_CLOAB|nr:MULTISPECIES: spermidine/putrescine ABC transporter substrate-binding protein [Clostridium]AAK78813.1 Spermidine/putrescine-binding periplasmic protein [Clostridium acetobutylicum ATCC 824]ADZ19887.1 Spermidine/putrescine-binding periplasmic protein [Clostridium acetobutylicum EA 2018]AEI33178.1 spermidine/putrescine-binding periplasmic protein [Clostridium acetobutylicum DSM 1731]AWV80531.1 spermidine/putrescine ABC transporter substrate-binding protein [Clostridium acetobutylicum]KHD35855
MKNIKKIIALAATVILTCSSLTACNLKPGSDKKTITVFNWGEYIDKDILKDFTAKTGIKVNYETFSTNEEMYEKVKSGTNNYDLICPSDYMVDRMIKENSVQKIDFKSLSNYSNIDNKYKNLSYDPKNSYSVPYMWGTIGIIYDKTQIKDKLDSWNDLWNPKYKDKVYMSDDMRNSLGISLKRLGYSMNSKNKNEISKASSALIEQKKLINPVYVGDEIKDDMRNGEKPIGVIYSGDAAVLMNENPNKYEYVIPKEGTNLWFDSWVIPKNAKNKEAAEKFLNYLLDAKVNKKNVDYIGYGTPNTKTFDMLNDKVKNNKASYPDDASLKNSEVFTDLGNFKKLYNDAWVNITAKK